MHDDLMKEALMRRRGQGLTIHIGMEPATGAEIESKEEVKATTDLAPEVEESAEESAPDEAAEMDELMLSRMGEDDMAAVKGGRAKNLDQLAAMEAMKRKGKV